MSESVSAETQRFGRLGGLAALFLRLGVIGFGGPLAHVGLMEDQVVKRRQWTTHEQFLEGLAICNLLPGPTSTQLSIYLGYLRAGPLGGLVSGSCFIGPAFVMVALLAFVYIQYGAIPQVGALFAAIGPVVIAIIVNTLYRSGKTALTSIPAWVIFLAACALTVFPLLPPAFNLLTILLLAGLAGIACFGRKKAEEQPAKSAPAPAAPAAQAEPEKKSDTSLKSVIAAPLLTLKALAGPLTPSVGLLALVGLTFFKIGLLMFGGGLVVAPLLQQELVDSQHWLTTKQLVDGLALGQLTPGPVTTVATFAGYAVAGFPGAVVATVAVFAPSFILVISLTPLLLRLRNSIIARAFLKGITAGALGAIAAAAILFGRATIVDPFTAIIALLSLILLLRWNLNTTYLILGAAALGLARTLFKL
ncbi:MAG TPA: chromate efflux transporter [Ktedonobacterales bacterium]